MLAFQIKALETKAVRGTAEEEKERIEAKEGVCAMLYGEDEDTPYVVDVYKMTGEAAKKPAEEMMPHRTEFSGPEAWPRALDYLEQICDASPVFVHENERVDGDGFAAVCVTKILGRYYDTFYSKERD